jgi:hypothetical protein
MTPDMPLTGKDDLRVAELVLASFMDVCTVFGKNPATSGRVSVREMRLINAILRIAVL